MLNHAQQQQLLALARSSIEYGLCGVDFAPPANILHTFTKPVACFVTLTLNQRLRGCIGTLEAREPLAIAVANNAYKAAFEDPRFAPLSTEEFTQISVEISLLNTPKAMKVSSESDLLAQLQPHRDGLILQAGSRRATFLPSVWQHITDPAEFIKQLKIKAGLPPQGWKNDYCCWRYHTEVFGD